MSKIKSLIPFILPVILTGCAVAPSPDTCDVGKHYGLPMMHPSTYPGQFVHTAKVAFDAGDKSFSFVSQIQVSNNQLVFVAYTLSGQNFFVLQYAPGSIDYQGPEMQEGFQPENLLFDLGLIYAEFPAIRQCIQQAGLSLEVIQPSDTDRQFRLPQFAGNIRIRKTSQANDQPGTIEYHNEVFHYNIRIDTIDFVRI